MNKRMAVILAAGKGTRMKSDLHKVLHPIHGLTMIEHVLRSVRGAQVDQIVTIVGHGADEVQAVIGEDAQCVLQEEQLGTAHAVQQAAPLIEGQGGSTLVVCGDTPLLRGETLQALIAFHEEEGAQATILTAYADQPKGYGRIIRNEAGHVDYIVEEKDANSKERAVNEINTGTYVFDNGYLFDMLKQVDNDNAQGEYYLPDVIKLLNASGKVVQAYPIDDVQETIGINDRLALSQASQYMGERINCQHMRNGVSFQNPATTYIEVDVEIGPDTYIEGGVSLKGNTSIASHVTIGANSEIVDSRIENDAHIRQSVIEESYVGERVTIGPFAHLRPASHLEEDVHIGNFVEVKNSTVGSRTKAGHLTYIGDADLGRDINIGCGSIFVNYDGKHKHRTQVGDGSFIGCNTNLIAPLTLEERTITAAGSVITEDVPTESLAVARSRQTNIDNYWQRFVNK